KATVEREIHEDDQVEGHRATETIDQAWTKYTGAEPPYGLRDPSMDERRGLFEGRVDSVPVFGQPYPLQRSGAWEPESGGDPEERSVSSWPRAAVVGGSLGGLTAALVLRDLGCEVDVFERSAAGLGSRGGGLRVP